MAAFRARNDDATFFASRNFAGEVLSGEYDRMAADISRSSAIITTGPQALIDTVPGDTSTTATLTVGAASIISAIDTIADQDFYQVTLVAGHEYQIGMFGYSPSGPGDPVGPNGAPLLDSFIELYDGAGNLITSADGGSDTTINAANSGFDALLTFTATASGTYYVNARAFDNVPADGSDGDMIGDYGLYAKDVTDDASIFTPYYDANSPLYAIDWGTQVNKVHQSYRNPDGNEGTHDTGNPQSPVDPGAAFGNPGKNVISIYFAQAGDIFVSNDPTNPGLPPATITATGVQQFEHDAVMTALAQFSKVADIVYVEVNDRNAADFVYTSYAGTPGPGVSLLGSMSPPDESDEGLAQFNSADYRWNATDLQQGGFSFVTLIHELGHGHGLAHPHDNGGHSGIMHGVEPEGAGVADYTTGDFDLNQGVFTMMSYEDGWQDSPYGNAPTTGGYGYLGGLMALDIAAIQDKYGVNEDWATGNDFYTLKDVNAPGTYFTSIWDAGGTDGIVYVGARDANIDLRAATLQYEAGGGGWVSYADGIYGGFTIANGVTIENATGGSGNDVLIGNDADNLLRGGAGADALNGGAGTDTADYAGNFGAVWVDLAAGAGHWNYAQGDTLVGIENVTGTEYNDSLVGNAGVNALRGNGGDDRLVGGFGGDVLDGGAGTDTADYTGNFGGVWIDLSTGIGKWNYAEGDTLTGIENLIGTAYVDRLIGNGANNRLSGGFGGDLLDGGAGTGDTADYAGNYGGVWIDLSTGVGKWNYAEGDSLSNIENVVGTDWTDWLTGNAGNNRLEGGKGDDRLVGGGGNDVLKGGLGADLLDGGANVDTADYSGNYGGVWINLATGAGKWNYAEGDTLVGIDKVIGTDFTDWFESSGHTDFFTGGGADDQFIFQAGFGQDVITDFTGNGAAAGDTIRFGAGTFTSFADVMSHAVQHGGDVVITLDAHDILTLQNTQLASLNANDFLFG